MSATAAEEAEHLKGEAGAAFAKKQVREAELLYRRALGCLRSSRQPQPSEQQQEQQPQQQQQSDAGSALLEATLVSNIAICRKLVGGIKQGLKLSEEVLAIIDACAEGTSEHRQALEKLREKNAVRVRRLTALHEGLVATEQLRDGSTDAAAVGVADSCTANRAAVQTAIEYYFFGHDDPKSLVEKIATKEGARKVDNVSVFFGGCGDCRHVFATLFDLVKRVHPAAKCVKDVHLELNDLNPMSLARFAVVCSMSAEVHKLQKKHSARHSDKIKLKQLAMALQSFAVDCFIEKAHWNGIIKPALARVRAAFDEHASVACSTAAAQASESNPLKAISLSWLTCDAKAATGVVRAIDQWLTQVGKFSPTYMRQYIAKFAEFNREQARTSYLKYPALRKQLLARFHAQRRQYRVSFEEALRGRTERDIDTLLREDTPRQRWPAVLNLPLERKRQMVVENMIEHQLPSDDPARTMAEINADDCPRSMDDVDIVIFITKRCSRLMELKSVLLDVVFWYKHNCYPPVDVPLNPDMASELKRDTPFALERFMQWVDADFDKGAHGLRLPSFDFNNERILVNPAMFDQRFLDESQTTEIDVTHFTRPSAAMLYLDFIDAGFFALSPQVTGMADLAAQFYGEVGSSLALLSQEDRARHPADSHPGLSVKLSSGDVYNALETAGRAGTVFDYVYLSNIPDYTGMLPVFSYGITALKPHGILESNILANTRIWETSEDYLYHMGFCDFEEAKNYCQSQFIGDKNPFGAMVWQKSPKNWWLGGEVLKKKSAFLHWLHDVLLNILLPSHEVIPSRYLNAMKATRPQSLAMFFRLAMSWRHPLPRIWHAEVVRDVLKNGKLKTKWQQHPERTNPVLLKARVKSGSARNVDLTFALAEVATLAAAFRTPVACLPATSRKAAQWQMAPLSLEEICRVRTMKGQMTQNPVRKADPGFGVAILKNMPATEVHLIDIRHALRHSADPSPAVRMHPNADLSTSNVKVLHLISTCHVDNTAGYVDFLLPCEEWKTLRKDKSVSVVLFSYYNWMSVAAPQPLATSTQSTNDLQLGGPMR